MVSYYKEHKKIFLSFLILVFLFYGNSLKNKYALDDDYVTVTNFPVSGQPYTPNNVLAAKGFKGIPTIWKSCYAHDSESSFEYRPVTSSSFAMEYQFFGQKPFVSHLINILLYYFSICILFCVLLRLFESYSNNITIAFLTSVIFLIHPIHTEVVDNIKCRDEIFALFFPLIAFWFSLSFYKKPNLKDGALIILFLLLGILSKRSAMVFIAIIPLAFLFYRNINRKLIIGTVLSCSLSYILFILIKKSFITEKVIRHFYTFENPLYDLKLTIFIKMIIALKSLGFYLKLLIFPFPLRFYYGGNFMDTSASVNLDFIISIAFLGASAYYFYKSKNKLFLFGFFLFTGSISPFLNFIVPVAGVFGDRLTYISTIGFSIMIVSIIEPYFKNTVVGNFQNLLSKPKIFGVIITIISMIYVWNRNPHWYNKLSLFEHDIAHLEKSAKANSLLANEYFEMMRQPQTAYSGPALAQKALKHYSMALKADSSIHTCYNNAGVVYYSYLKDIKNAKYYFQLAIKRKPNYPMALENLGNCYKIENDINKAASCYIESIKYNNNQTGAYLSLTRMLFDHKKYPQAYQCAKIANKQIPNYYHLVALEANCLLMMGSVKQSLRKFEEAYALSGNQELAKFMSQKYLEIGDSLNFKKYNY